MKINIYTICKNEEKNIERWFNCCKGADSITFLDTGSTDNTIKIAKGLGITVLEQKIEPFRFDVARNASLALTPDCGGLYIPLELDMFLRDNALDILREECGDNEYAMVEFGQLFNFEENGIWFAHRRNVTWVHPVYEQIAYVGGKKHCINEILIDHVYQHPIEKLKWYESLAMGDNTPYGKRALEQIRNKINKKEVVKQ